MSSRRWSILAAALLATVAAAVLVVVLVGDDAEKARKDDGARVASRFAKNHPFVVESSGRGRVAAVSSHSRRSPNAYSGIEPGQQRYSSCSDPWVTAAIRRVINTDHNAVGKACDPYLYGRARWTTFDDLVAKVRTRLADCRDPWVTLAVMEVFNRVAQPFDCDLSQYGGGRWNGYEQLKNLVADKTNGNHPPPDRDWKVLVLVYVNTQLPAMTFPDGRAVSGTPLSASMTKPDGSKSTVDHVRQTAREFASKARSLSGQRMKVRLFIAEIRRPISSLTPEGSGHYLGPSDIRQELDAYAPEGRYDSVIAVWRNDDGTKQGPNLSGVGSTGLGLATARLIGTPQARYTDGTNGATYAMVTLPYNHGRFGGGVEPASSILLHEWLHGVEAVYRDWTPQWANAFPNCGDVFLHCAGSYGFTFQTGPGWDRWYEQQMRGTVSGRFGVPADAWARGGPRTQR